MAGGELIREARLRAGLTQTELSKLTGRERSVIARWEQGVRTPLVVSVPPLAEALGVGVADLFEPPASEEQRGRGRPPKAEPEPPRRRGRKK